MLTATLARLNTAPRVTRGQPAPHVPAIKPGQRCIIVRYTSQTGRTGQGGEEEKPLRETMRNMEDEQKYGVDEEKEPGYYHESRSELERSGAVVHEEVGRGRDTSSTRSAPESGTEGRTPEGGAGAAPTAGRPGGFSPNDDDIASAPESGTVRP